MEPVTTSIAIASAIVSIGGMISGGRAKRRALRKARAEALRQETLKKQQVAQTDLDMQRKKLLARAGLIASTEGAFASSTVSGGAEAISHLNELWGARQIDQIIRDTDATISEINSQIKASKTEQAYGIAGQTLKAGYSIMKAPDPDPSSTQLVDW